MIYIWTGSRRQRFPKRRCPAWGLYNRAMLLPMLGLGTRINRASLLGGEECRGFSVNATEFIDHLRASPGYSDQIVHVQELPEREAIHGSPQRPLNPILAQALRAAGIVRLYRHQALAVDAARSGQSLIVVTGTSSGKTLCYNIPVLEGILGERMSRALYLFPTKALAQDQLRALQQLTAHPGLDDIHFGTYDGDTPASTRAQLRKRASVILSNPDMLHLAILPNHPSWASFFRHLNYVVLDEAHAYRGIFGSHVACLLRRLQRVCALYGSNPQILLCSATIANPAEHGRRLIGRDLVVVDQDGAPRGPRQFVLWNPPYTDERAGTRRSINSEATWVFTKLVECELRNITFTKARKIAELIALWAQQSLRRERPDLAERISAYRGGYLPAERREIERRLFSGELLGVAATNALELGIDVGKLDATLQVGYPGTIASTWQQAGRAGRGRREALSILMGHDNPLDQYFMRHPRELFDRSPEHALINPQNEHVLTSHLLCACFESPLRDGEAELWGPRYAACAAELELEGLVEKRDRRWYCVGDEYPAQHINLRATGETSYLVIDESRNELLEEIDAETAFFRVHPGAIHIHRGEHYRVTSLDLGARIASVRPFAADYYTQVHELNDVHIIRSTDARHLEVTDLFFGNVRVTQRVVGYLRKHQTTDATLSQEPLDLPPTAFETEGLWFEIPKTIVSGLVHRGLDLAGGLHGVEHACIGMLPLFTMCDRDDIGGLSSISHVDTGQPQVFIHDGYAGGVGIARKGYELVEELWQRTLEVVRDCPCEAGCPSCIYSPKCGNNNEPLDKAATVLILERLLGTTGE